MKGINVFMSLFIVLLFTSSAYAVEYLDSTTVITPTEDGGFNVQFRVTGVKTGTLEEYLTKYPSNVVFVVDASGSMQTIFKGKSRLDWALRSFKELTEVLHPDSKAGLVSFSDSAIKERELISAKAWKTEPLPSVETGGITNMGEGLREAISMLREEAGDAPKMIILLSDGKNNGPKDPVRIAETGLIPVYTVGIGGRGEVDEETLQNIADTSGGLYVYVDELDQLKKEIQELIFREKELSARNLEVQYIPVDTVVFDPTTVHVTTGNIEKQLGPIYGMELSSGGADGEVLKVSVPQLSLRDEVLLEFKVYPKTPTAGLINMGKIILSGEDPVKTMSKSFNLGKNYPVNLEVLLEYPDAIYHLKERKLNAVVKNPSASTVTAEIELQIIGSLGKNIQTDKATKTLTLAGFSSDTATWMLKTKEPVEGSAILRLKISGENVAKKTLPEKEIPVEKTYYDLSKAGKAKMLRNIGILAFIVAIAFMGYGIYLKSNVESKINGIYEDFDDVYRDLEVKFDRLREDVESENWSNMRSDCENLKEVMEKYKNLIQDKGKEDYY